VKDLLQHDAQTRERLLWTSGGLLNLTKCLYYVSVWRFDDEGRASLTPKTLLPQLTLTSGDSPTRNSVRQFNYSVTHEYLGNHMAPSLQMTTAYHKLLLKSQQFARRLASSPLSKRDAWIAYFAVYLPSMTYTLTLTAHSPKKLRKVQSSAICATLNKLGFNRNTPRAVVFGPCLQAGLSLRDLATEQGIALLVMLLRHLRTVTAQGKLLSIALVWWQLVIGTSFPLLEYPAQVLLHDEAHIFPVVRQFLRSIEGSLHITEVTEALPPPFRERNHCLIEVISSLPAGLTRAHALTFNRVRLFLGVFYLSELTTADGTALSRDAWDGSRPRLSPLLWPYQPQPGPKSFRVWRRLLANAFLRADHQRVSVKTRDLALRNPLRQWLPASDSYRYQWETFYAPSVDSLFCVATDGTTFAQHPSRKTRRRPKHPVRAFDPTASSTTSTLPSNAVPVDVSEEPYKLVIPHFISGIVPDPVPQPSPLTWAEYFVTLPAWERFLLQNVTILDRDLLFVSLRTADKIYLASDGGAENCKGSFGCVIATDDTIVAECGGFVEGADPKSFRAEGYGMLAILRLLFHLRWFYLTRNHALRISVHSDSERLIKRLEKSLSLTYAVPRRSLFSEADVELQILDALATFPPDQHCAMLKVTKILSTPIVHSSGMQSSTSVVMRLPPTTLTPLLTSSSRRPSSRQVKRL
jgi:hypothetical protein